MFDDNRYSRKHGEEGVFESSSTASFSVFVGLSDNVSRDMVGAAFSKAGRIQECYVQVRRKEGRRFRFGFLRYSTDHEAWRAIHMFNGVRFEGAYLEVKKAKFQTKGSMYSSFIPTKGT